MALPRVVANADGYMAVCTDPCEANREPKWVET